MKDLTCLHYIPSCPLDLTHTGVRLIQKQPYTLHHNTYGVVFYIKRAPVLTPSPFQRVKYYSGLKDRSWNALLSYKIFCRS